MLEDTDDATLFSFCQTNSRTAEICRDQNFWRRRYVKKYGEEAARYKPQNRTWRNHYLKTFIDLNSFSGPEWQFSLRGKNPKPWKFFNLIGRWDIKTFPTHKNIFSQEGTNFGDLDERYHNAFYLLNLGDSVTIETSLRTLLNYNLQSWNTGTKNYFSPMDVLQMIYEYYQQPATEEDLNKAMALTEQEDFFVNRDDVISGKLKRADLLGIEHFFHHFIFYSKKGQLVVSLSLDA